MLGMLDGLPHQLHSEAVATVPLDHEYVAQPRHARAVRDHAREPDLLVAAVGTDHPRGLPNETLDRVPIAAADPIRLFGQVPMHRVDVHAIAIVVQLVAARQLATHQQMRPSRRCSSAGSTFRTRRSSAMSRSANHTPEPSRGASTRTSPHGPTIIEWPWERRCSSGDPNSPHCADAATKHWFSIARARSNASQCAIPV